MALQLNREKLCCRVCLDLLRDPVTVPCGHSFCMSCIESRWKEEDSEEVYSCPLCRQTFTPRPAVVRNVMFADLVEELKKTKLLGAPVDYATPTDVACDVCADRKLRAVKSCLVCRVSYCELHLQPHYESPAFGKHKLVKPSENLQEKICSPHDEEMKIYCRTDQETICFLCSLDEHKDHDTVSAAAERREKSREVETRRQKVQLRLQARERDVEVLQLEMKAINQSADKAVSDSEKVLSGLVNLIEERLSDVQEQIRSQQETEITRAEELRERLKVEIAELKMEDAQLEKLLHSDDHVHFLLSYPSLTRLTESAGLPGHNTHNLQYFEDVTAAVSKAGDKLEDLLRKEWPKILRKLTEVDVFLPQPEPKTRAEFLQHARRITLDPNTVNSWLGLSDRNRKATVMREKQAYPGHPERFTDWLQVLSKDRFTGRCYWEVERSGGVAVAVAYKDISRAGTESGFGNNDKSWALGCFDCSYYFRHNNVKTLLSGPRSSRMGVYLDHKAGTLSFYTVSETMTLLHKVQTRFTQPLHAGLWIYWAGDTAELGELE